MKFSHSILITLTIFQIVQGNVIVKRRKTDQTINQFYDLPAQFGRNIPPNGMRVYPIKANPEMGCSKLDPPPNNTDLLIPRKYVVLISRNNCTFEEKVRFAQAAKYHAAIIYNIGSDELEQMSAKNGSDIYIPSVFIGESNGRLIVDEYVTDADFVLIINDELPFNINTHLILPFSILVGLCFIVMIIYIVYKCVREQRRLRQHRLPRRLLKKIPIIKFDNHPYETCCICLEDYAKGDRLRILPCQHAYHCHCIDTWLTKNRRVCPICKRRVFVREAGNSNRRRSNSSESDSEDDTQPLINVANEFNSTNHGTFHQEEEVETNEETPQEENPNTTDDESILVNTNRRNRRQRENPFDRQPASQVNGSRETNEPEHPRSIWNLLRWWLFRRTPNNTSNEFVNPAIDNSVNRNNDTPSNIETVQATSIQMPRSASNNILNTSLSGSFKEDEEEIVASIYESIVDNTNTNNETTDGDVFIATPSHGGLGVAALPNTNLNRRNASTF